MFTGDATSTQEEYVVGAYKSNLYNQFFNQGINLENIDFLMLPDGGDSSGSSSKFLSLTKPSNAIISVGGANDLGHPSSLTLTRLFEANEHCTLYRTDVYGNISVIINNKTQRKVVYSISN